MSSQATKESSERKASPRFIGILSSVLGFMLVALGAWLIYDEFTNDSPTVEDIQVPKEISDKFLTDVAFTRQLEDTAMAIAHQSYFELSFPSERLSIFSELFKPSYVEKNQDTKKSDAKKAKGQELKAPTKEQVQNVQSPLLSKQTVLLPKFDRPKEEKDVDIQVPTLGSLRSFVRSIKRKLPDLLPDGLVAALNIHNPPNITGEINKQANGQFALTLRSDAEGSFHPEPIEAANATELARKGGEALLQLYSPCIAALNSYQQELITLDFVKTSRLIEPCRNGTGELVYIGDLLPGLIDMAKGNYQGAEDYYNDILKNKAGDKYLINNDEKKLANVHFLLGVALQNESRVDEKRQALPQDKVQSLQTAARNKFKDAKNIDRSFMYAYYALAKIDGTADQEDNYRELIEENQGNKDALANIWILIGNAALERDKADIAISSYKKVIDNFGHKNAQAYNNLGLAYLVKDNKEEAFKKFSAAIDCDSQYADAYYNKGLLEYTRNNYDNAFPLLEKSVNLNPKFTYAYFISGKARSQVQDFDGAMKDFDSYLSVEGRKNEISLALNEYGNALWAKAARNGNNKNLIASALEKYKKAVDMNKGFLAAYWNLYWTQIVLHDNSGAEATLNTITNLLAEQIGERKNEAEIIAAPVQPDAGDGSLSAERERTLGNSLSNFSPWLWSGGLAVLISCLIVVILTVKLRGAKIGRVANESAGTTPSDPMLPQTLPQKPTSRKEPKEARRFTHVGPDFPIPDRERPGAMLVCVQGAAQGRRFPVANVIVNLGANPENDLCIQGDEYISGNHAQLRFQAGSLVVTDRGSRNGTLVNGQKIAGTARALKPGDLLQIGRTIFEVHSMEMRNLNQLAS